MVSISYGRESRTSEAARIVCSNNIVLLTKLLDLLGRHFCLATARRDMGQKGKEGIDKERTTESLHYIL